MERERHAQKLLQDLRFTRKNCIVVKLKMHNTESCCQEADTSTMLGILLPTGDFFFFFKCFMSLSYEQMLLEEDYMRHRQPTSQTYHFLKHIQSRALF